MRTGVVFPQAEIGDDPVLVRDFAQTAEGLGYTHLLVFDHVLGAGLARRPGWRGPYDAETRSTSPSCCSAISPALTERIELVTGVIVLPQRQTALVAKQAAEVDVLSGGRLRLGVGVGWNDVEYEALGKNFHDRGRRIEEQIALLRALWTEPVVDFEGRWHRVPDAGINPLPVQRPIPVWIGGQAEPVLRRIGVMGDGWFPQMLPDTHAAEMLDRLRGYAADGRARPAADRHRASGGEAVRRPGAVAGADRRLAGPRGDASGHRHERAGSHRRRAHRRDRAAAP